MKQPKSIAILGLGWLGLPLAKTLHQSGYLVHGSVRSSDKLDQLQGLPFDLTRLVLNPDGVEGTFEFLNKASILVLTIPPGRKEGVEETYPAMIGQFLKHAPSDLKVIFTSTTGVYAADEHPVSERTTPHPSKSSGKAVLHAERMLRSHYKGNLTILHAFKIHLAILG